MIPYRSSSTATQAYIYTSANTGTISGSSYAGGIAGYMNYSYYNSYSSKSYSYIYNSYNIGTVECDNTTYEGGITGYCNYGSIYNSFNYDNTITKGIGYLNSVTLHSSTCSNCYYLSGGTSSGSGTAKSATAFADGSVAYLLNNKATGGTTWYQNLDMGEADAYPVLSDEHYRVYYNQSDSTYSNIRSAITGVCGGEDGGMNLFYSFDVGSNSLTITGEGSMADYSESTNAPWYAYKNYIHYLITDEYVVLDDYATYGLKNLNTVYCYENSSVDSYFTDTDITKKYLVSEDIIQLTDIDEDNHTFTININTDNFGGKDAKYLDEVRVVINYLDENKTVKNYQINTSDDKYIDLAVTYENSTGKDAKIQAEVIAKNSADDNNLQYYVSQVYDVSEG